MEALDMTTELTFHDLEPGDIFSIDLDCTKGVADFLQGTFMVLPGEIGSPEEGYNAVTVSLGTALSFGDYIWVAPGEGVKLHGCAGWSGPRIEADGGKYRVTVDEMVGQKTYRRRTALPAQTLSQMAMYQTELSRFYRAHRAGEDIDPIDIWACLVKVWKALDKGIFVMPSSEVRPLTVEDVKRATEVIEKFALQSTLQGATLIASADAPTDVPSEALVYYAAKLIAEAKGDDGLVESIVEMIGDES
jgi:hypothetical protein